MDLRKRNIRHGNRHSFWYYFYKCHLYTSKAEALFKACIISVSWVGAFWNDVNATAYYLFSIAIIMEYAVQLIKSEEFIPKILPCILTISNVFVALISSGQLFSNETETYWIQCRIEMITMLIVWLDTVIILLIEKPKEYKIEDALGQCGTASYREC